MAQCYMCGAELIRKKNSEKDHVPPECIFPEDHKPLNLFTLRCCTSCHDEFDVLDERMRNYLALLAINESGAAGAKAKRAVLSRPKLREEFLSHTRNHPSLKDAAGDPRLLFFFDDEDLKRWLVRIVKGLYYRKYKRRIDNDLTYRVEKLPELTPQPSMTFPMDEGLEARPYFVYGVIEEPNSGYWVLIFYDRLIFTVTAERPKA
jgi:hypothetical protein